MIEVMTNPLQWPSTLWFLLFSLLIGTIALSAMLYSAIDHHKNHPHTAFHAQITTEIGWMLIPIFIIALTAYPATHLSLSATPATSAAPVSPAASQP